MIAINRRTFDVFLSDTNRLELGRMLYQEVKTKMGESLSSMSSKDFGLLRERAKKEVQERLGKKNCFLCGSNGKKANSHNIPAQILRNIADRGKLFILDKHIVDSQNHFFQFQPGINVTQTFFLLCEKCESNSFSQYENNAISNSVPYNNLQYSQLELKNTLYLVHHKEFLQQYFLVALERITQELDYITENHFLNDNYRTLLIRYLQYSHMDLHSKVSTCGKDLVDLRKTAKRIKESQKSNRYTSVMDLIIERKIDFTISQGILPTYSETGENVNRTTDFRKHDYNFGYLFVSVFPLDLCNARICVFFNRKHKSTLDFIKREFDSLDSVELKLKKLSDLILLYSDKLVFNTAYDEKIKHIFKKCPELKELDPTQFNDSSKYLSILSQIEDINLF